MKKSIVILFGLLFAAVSVGANRVAIKESSRIRDIVAAASKSKFGKKPSVVLGEVNGMRQSFEIIGHAMGRMMPPRESGTINIELKRPKGLGGKNRVSFGDVAE